jgi:sortase A
MTDERRRRKTRARTAPRALSVVGVIGELFITVGVLVFLFLGWQLWLNDLIVGADQNRAAVTLAKNWETDTPSHAHVSPVVPPDYGPPAVAVAPKNAEQFAVMYVPRFGADYARSISEGVSTTDVLDKNGIGHYPGTQMPGAIGNFAVAAHRTTHGAPFKQIASLTVGDKLYLQTQDGYYTYDFRGLEYVRPSAVDVLDAVPRAPGVTPTARVLTLTSCNPMFSAAERIIAYSVLEAWQPTSAGPPPAILASVSAKG